MRVAIANDEPVAVAALRRVVTSVAGYRVAWVARDGAEAVRRCAADRPDVVLMDLLMPEMDGVEATRRIMAESPCSILVVTADVLRNTSRVFAAMGAGALDVVATPTLEPEVAESSARALLIKIRMVERLAIEHDAPRVRAGADGPCATVPALVAIGASAGGPPAVARLLGDLSPELPLAVLVVQHVDAMFVDSMAAWLDSQCSLTVRVAREGDVPAAGFGYLAAGDLHLVVRANGRLGYDAEPADAAYRPSADALFASIAANWRGIAVGVVLSGMGHDGAAGLKRLRAAGARTIAQDEATSAVYGMPRAAVEANAVSDVLPLAKIGPLLRELSRRPSTLSVRS